MLGICHLVSYNSTKRRVFYCQSRRLQICHCVQLLNALFCCLWRNVEASCHKHFVVFFSHNQHRHLLPAMCHNLRDGGHHPPATVDNTWHVAALTAGTKARQAQNRDFCLPRPSFYAPVRGVPIRILLCRLAWKNQNGVTFVWLPDGEKF